MNWLKQHARHCAAILGASMIATGIFLLIPPSPWILIVLGVLILLGTLVSLIPPEEER